MTVLDLRTTSKQVSVVVVEEGAAVVYLRGEIDVCRAAELREHLAQADASGAQTVVVDLSEASFGDSYGVVLLLRASARALSRGAAFTVRSPSQQARRTLYATGLIRRFTVDGCP